MALHHRKHACAQLVLHELHVSARDQLLDAQMRAEVEALRTPLRISHLPRALTVRRILLILRRSELSCVNLSAITAGLQVFVEVNHRGVCAAAALTEAAALRWRDFPRRVLQDGRRHHRRRRLPPWSKIHNVCETARGPPRLAIFKAKMAPRDERISCDGAG